MPTDKDLKVVQLAICEVLFGSPQAVGYPILASCWKAARAALKELEKDGWDMFVYPSKEV